MRIDIINGDVVTGDGKSYLENTSVVIEDGLITQVPRLRYIPYNFYSHRVIDANGGIIMPGLINTHVHAVCFGPPLPWGWLPLPEERILGNLNTHLLQGTTTVLDLDGFVLPFENEAINKVHPVNVKMATLHTPQNVIAGEMESGLRIEAHHRGFTAQEAVSLGAVALGEVGAPSTSYGTYEKFLRFGGFISARAALALDDAYMEGDEQAFLEAMKQAGLEQMGVEKARRLVKETSIDVIQAANEAILEAIEYAPMLGVPAVCHAEPPSYEAVLQAARMLGPRLLAAHVNHHCTVAQAVNLATEVKRCGGSVEIITADSFGARQIEPDPAHGFALLERGLVDVISTDYSGGFHDSMLLYFQKAVEHGVVTLPEVVRLSTSSPASIIPGLAPSKGLIEPGKVADIIIVDKNDISKVRYVIIAGRIVVEEGRIVV